MMRVWWATDSVTDGVTHLRCISIMSPFTIRTLGPTDVPAIAHICAESPWVVMQFEQADLPHLVATRPACGAFTADGTLKAWLMATTFTPPFAWLGGFGVPWSERAAAFTWLDALLPPWEELLRARGNATVVYSGNDDQNDWLLQPLLDRGFTHLAWLRGYDKLGTAVLAPGNQQVHVRSINPEQDIPDLLALEAQTFAPYWRFDARTFAEMAAAYPFFVVAHTPAGQLAGFQASLSEEGLGYLVRIAVAPALQGQGIGARLMAEAMHYFREAQVERVLLNAEETNTPAHRLYEAWGFVRIAQRGFALQRPLRPASFA